MPFSSIVGLKSFEWGILFCIRLDASYQKYKVIKGKIENFSFDKVESFSQPSVYYFSLSFFFIEHLEILDLCSNLEQSHISRPCMRWISYVWQSSILHHFLLRTQKPKVFPCFTHWALLKVSSTQAITAAKLCFIPITRIFVLKTWNLHAPCTLLMLLVCKIQSLPIFNPSRTTEGGYFFLLPPPFFNRKTVHGKR